MMAAQMEARDLEVATVCRRASPTTWRGLERLARTVARRLVHC